MLSWLASTHGVDDVEGARGVRGLIAEGGQEHPRDGERTDEDRAGDGPEPERTAAGG